MRGSSTSSVHDEPARRWGLDPDEWEQARRRLDELLLDAAGRGGTVTYGEAARVAFGGRRSARSRALMDLLAQVDRDARSRSGVMPATLVVRADTGRPGEGYFAFLERGGLLVDDREEAWLRHARKIWARCAEGGRPW